MADRLRMLLDPLTSAPVRALVEGHLRLMRSQSPAHAVHALPLDALQQPDVTFWSAWVGDALVGCGALRSIDAEHGEIKSMHIAASWRGRGLASQMLAHIEAEARARGMTRLSLETGSQDAYAPARELYRRHGYRPCDAFAGYVGDPNSAFMTKTL